MKLKRAKAYKKLLHQYELNFGFREPYQVLLDSAILEDAYRFKIDLLARLQKVLGGTVKPMITTCSMRHLYNAKPKNETLILQAKEYERRRCNHQDLDEPLSSLECLESVVDGKGNGTNKNRYIVASDELEVRKKMRAIAGVPLIYISKSVVLMEPMAGASEERRDIEEKSKFKQGLKGQRKPEQMQKRKREEDEEVGGNEKGVDGAMEEARTAKNKRQRGPKQPNPLSMKKAKKETDAAPMPKKSKSSIDGESASAPSKPDDEASSGRKRKRRPKAKADGDVSQTAEDAGSP